MSSKTKDAAQGKKQTINAGNNYITNKFNNSFK